MRVATVRKRAAKAKLSDDPSIRQVWTPGQIAAMLRASTRTVSAWIDSGQMRGYRLPPKPARGESEGDRRVTREDLVAFLLRYRLPLGPLAGDVGPECVPGVRDLLVVGPRVHADLLRSVLPENAYCVRWARDEFAAGWECRGHSPDVLVADLVALGRTAGLSLARRVRAPHTVLVAADDDGEPLAVRGAVILRPPAGEGELAAAVLRGLAAKGQ